MSAAAVAVVPAAAAAGPGAAAARAAPGVLALPPDVWVLRVASCLPPPDVLRLRRTCRVLNATLRDDRWLRGLAERALGRGHVLTRLARGARGGDPEPAPHLIEDILLVEQFLWSATARAAKAGAKRRGASATDAHAAVESPPLPEIHFPTPPAAALKTKSKQEPLQSAVLCADGRVYYWKKGVGDLDATRVVVAGAAREAVEALREGGGGDADGAAPCGRRGGRLRLVERQRNVPNAGAVGVGKTAASQRGGVRTTSLAAAVAAAATPTAAATAALPTPVHNPQIAFYHRASGVLAVGAYDRSIRLVDTRARAVADPAGHSGAGAHTVIRPKLGQSHTGQLSSLRMDEGAVYSGSFDASIKVWARSGGRLLATIGGHHAGAVQHLLVDPLLRRNGLIASASSDVQMARKIFTHDLETGQTTGIPLPLIGMGVRALTSFADGGDAAAAAGTPGVFHNIIAAGMNNQAVLVDRRAGTPVAQVRMTGGLIYSLATGGHDSWMFAAGGEAPPYVAGVDLRMVAGAGGGGAAGNAAAGLPQSRAGWGLGARQSDLHVQGETTLAVHHSVTASLDQSTRLFTGSRDGVVKLWSPQAPPAEKCVAVVSPAIMGSIRKLSWDGRFLVVVRTHHVTVLDFAGRAGVPTTAGGGVVARV